MTARLRSVGPVTVFVVPLDGDGDPGVFVETPVTSIQVDDDPVQYGSAPVNHSWFNFAAWRARRESQMGSRS